MRTKKMRFVSMILALAMLLAIAPVSAFAETERVNVCDVEGEKLKIATDGLPAIASSAQETYDAKQNGKIIWRWNPSSKTLIIWDGAQYSGAGETILNFPITVGGSFAVNLNGMSMGCITSGYYAKDILLFGEIAGGTFSNTISTTNGSKITGGVFRNKPNSTITSGASVSTVKAEGCTINKIIDGGAAYVVGAQTITVSTPVDERFIDWKSDDIVIDDSMKGKTAVDGVEYETLTFFAPAGKDITIVANRVATPLVIENGVPVYKNEPYAGHEVFDKWTYKINTLRIFDGYEADLKNNEVNWVVINKEGGVLKNGTITNTVTNYGTAKDITCTGDFTNNGVIESGVFSRYAHLGAQKDSACWVAVNGGKANGMQTAGVVGTQKVEVKANASADNPFEGWTYSGDVSDAVVEQIEAQKNNETMLLTLNGNDGGTMVLTAKYNKDSFALTMLDGKASVGETDVTAAVPGQTVTLSIDDSEIPEGMSFDHWVISPDVELEGGFKATDRTTSFTMPAQELTIYASLRTDSDDGTDAMTIVAGVAIGAGAAVLTYHIGTELYAKQVLGDGVAVPKTREDVALKAWELAGRPAVAVEGEPLSEAAQAEKWAVESGLMQNDAEGNFNGAKKMNKLKALRVLDAAKKLG